MPLTGGCSVTAFRRNISKLISEGRPHDQAVAIAMDTLRESCQKRGKPMPDMGEIVPDDELDAAVVEIILAKLDELAPSCREVWGLFGPGPRE